jgi:hypothetical protein
VLGTYEQEDPKTTPTPGPLKRLKYHSAGGRVNTQTRIVSARQEAYARSLYDNYNIYKALLFQWRQRDEADFGRIGFVPHFLAVQQ